MPFLENGERVDVMLNALGVINRLNSMQIFEQTINFIGNRVVDRLKVIDSMVEKENLLFDIVHRLCEREGEELKAYYNKLSKSEKIEFWEDIYKFGIFIHKPPMWEEGLSLFDRIKGIYKTYDWIKPVDVYVRRFGRIIKIMKPLIIGDIYMIKMKQTSKKGFSARSTGALSRKGVPDKSYRNKAHQDLYSSTPIRIGEQENVNSIIGVPPEIVAKLHLFYRSSVNGRRSLGKALSKGMKIPKEFKYDDGFTNRNVETLQAYLKAMGLKIEFDDPVMEIKIETGAIKSWVTESSGYFIGTETAYEDFALRDNIQTKYENDLCFVGTTDEYEDLLEQEYTKEKTLKDGGIYIDINL